MRRPHVLLVRAVLSHAGDEGLDRDYGLVVGVLNVKPCESPSLMSPPAASQAKTRSWSPFWAQSPRSSGRTILPSAAPAYRLFYWGVSDLKIEYTQLNRLTARVTRSPREYMPSLFCLTRAWTRGFVDAMRD